MIYDKLYPWQRNVLNKFAYKKSFGLFLDCGLGKTPLSLAFAEKNKCTKIIVITINPKAIETEKESGSWPAWIKEMELSYNIHNKQSKSTSFDNHENDVLIINYEGLFSRKINRKQKVVLKEKIQSFIESCQTHNVALIVDESHKVKSTSSMQTLAINKIKSLLNYKAKNLYTYLLTGTPFTTEYLDLYSQLKLLGYPDNKKDFEETFCIRGNLPGLLGWQQPIIGYKNVDVLFQLVHQYAITIKSDNVIDLPEKVFVSHTTRQSLEFNLFTKEKVYGKEIPKFDPVNLEYELTKGKVNNPYYRNLAYPSEKWLAETAGTFWMRARQISIGFQGNGEDYIWYDRSRLNQLKKFLEINPNNYILFYNYIPELLEIYPIVEELGYNIDVYCGEVKSLHFYNTYSNQTEEERLTNNKNIILANFASGSTGMNWQNYHEAIIFSVPLYKDYEQGIKRINRIGQKQTTIYHEFYQENWLDYSMRKSLKEGVDYNLDMFNADKERIEHLKEERKWR